MKISLAAIVVCLAVLGCQGQQETATAQRQGTLKMDNLTPQQQVEKVKSDPQIPEEYKKTFINSVQGQGSQPQQQSNGR